MSIDTVTERLIQRARHARRLSSEEEIGCIRAWHARRDRAAAGIIAEANLRHVVFTALKFRNYGVNVADLISEGNVGLMLALDRFDEAKGVRFATYAVYWIRAHIVFAVMSSWSLVSGAKGALSSRVFFRLRRERANLGPGDEQAGVQILASSFGVSERRMQEMLSQIDHRGVPLHAEANRSGRRVVDELAAEDDQEAELASHELAARLTSAIERARPSLSEREAFILDRRLLADPEDELSLGELSSHFGVSRERVRQLELRTRAKLEAEVSEEGVAAVRAA